MDIHNEAIELVLRLSLVRDWPELRGLLRRAAAHHDSIWQLPVQAALAAGGSAPDALPAVAAIACLHLGILLLDDLLDDDPRGEFHRLGAPATANLAAALHSLALEVAAPALAATRAPVAGLQALAQAGRVTALGQARDAANPATLAEYWQVAQTKSAPFFAAALQVGALCGGAGAAAAAQIYRLGGLYGVLIQINDDLLDTLAVPASPDWIQGRWPLPLLYAHTVPHPAQERFRQLRAEIQARPAASALAEAQAILIRCGAVSYGLFEMGERYRAARRLMGELRLPAPEPLAQVLENLVRPMRGLLGREFLEGGV